MDHHNYDETVDNQIKPSDFTGLYDPAYKEYRPMCSLLVHALMEAFHGNSCKFGSEDENAVRFVRHQEAYAQPGSLTVGAHQKALAEENVWRENMGLSPLVEADPGNQRTVDWSRDQIRKGREPPPPGLDPST
jgi:hypothetical protein